ncbi:MAG: ATP-binding protein [Thermoplasmata archaeon]|nr:ATP-binding protein [Thermoplasmata archaeon]
MREVLYDWNPWWTDKESIHKLAGVKRGAYLVRLKRLLEMPHVISLVGIRRCGKSTLMYQLIEHLLDKTDPQSILYLNLDDERLVGYDNVLEEVIKEHKRITGAGSTYVFLDEIQNVAGWERWVKRHYDRKEGTKFVVSGSSSSLISSDYSALLTGRNMTVKVYPLSFKEYLDFRGFKYSTGKIEETWARNREREDAILHHLDDYMEHGGFPEVVLGIGGREMLEEYFRDILYRDVVLRHDIRQPAKLERLGTYTMRNISNLLSYRKIANTTGLSVDTVKGYLSYLESAFLLFSNGHFSYSTTENLRELRPTKIYSTDVGLANSISMKQNTNKGRAAENIAALSLKRMHEHTYYWRDRQEIDIVIPESKMAVQVCYGDEKKREEEAFERFPERDYQNYILTVDEYSTSEKVKRVPLWVILLADDGLQ